MPRERPDKQSADGTRGHSSSSSAESIAFTMLAGVMVGAAAGGGIDWLAGIFPWFTIVGVFVGFAVGLYAIYLETK
jgi:F0F1-type ATP synthase assembly protein I